MLLQCETFSILFLCEDEDICRFSDLCSFKTDWKGALTQMFSYQYWEIFKNIYFKEHLWTAASRAPINGCSSKLKFGGQKQLHFTHIASFFIILRETKVTFLSVIWWYLDFYFERSVIVSKSSNASEDNKSYW